MSLLDSPVFPSRRAALFRGTDLWSCAACGALFPQNDDGVRVLVIHYDHYKWSQAAFFDEGVDSEYEIVRPRGLQHSISGFCAKSFGEVSPQWTLS